MKIKVGARGSKLSQRQVEEVMGGLGREYECGWVETVGDRDLISSLVQMDKTDFFTREIDEKVLEGKYDVGIHSAKDLPEPLPKGLKLIALTQGIDSSDSLVMRDGDRLETLKRGAVIGSSSFRRNRVVKGLRPDFLCKELRGPVDVRLEMLDRGDVDALVVAEAALIRLGLTGRNRMTLPGLGAPLQGKLAVVAREGDLKMEEAFRSLDSRKKKRVLYLGTEEKKGMVHLPLIEIIPRDFQGFEIQTAMNDFSEYTHVILTSKNGVRIFCDCMEHYKVKLQGKKVFAVGKVTAHALEERGVKVDEVAIEETQEGVVHLLAMEDLDDAYVLLPQSSRARSALSSSLMLRRVRHQKVSIYDTKKKMPSVKPDLESFDEIIFTSPSTVEAFSEVFSVIPKGIKLTSIGAITATVLKMKVPV